MKSALRCSGLRHRYPNASSEALRGIELEVKPGEVFGLVGPDGAGKTTLLKIFVGLLQATQGRLEVERGPGFGYIPQRFSLYRDLSVEENIDFFARIYGLTEWSQRKSELLGAVAMDRFRTRLANDLSGGMKQKLALCCALIHDPTTLVMDEPTTGVDPVSRREFWGVVFELQRRGLTVLSSTPYMDEAEQFDRVALLERGEFLRVGTTEEIKASVAGQVLKMLCSNPYQARLAMSALVSEVQLFGDSVHIFVERDHPELRQRLIAAVQQAGVQVDSLEECGYSIEDVFLRLTSDSGEAA